MIAISSVKATPKKRFKSSRVASSPSASGSPLFARLFSCDESAQSTYVDPTMSIITKPVKSFVTMTHLHPLRSSGHRSARCTYGPPNGTWKPAPLRSFLLIIARVRRAAAVLRRIPEPNVTVGTGSGPFATGKRSAGAASSISKNRPSLLCSGASRNSKSSFFRTSRTSAACISSSNAPSAIDISSSTAIHDGNFSGCQRRVAFAPGTARDLGMPIDKPSGSSVLGPRRVSRSCSSCTSRIARTLDHALCCR